METPTAEERVDEIAEDGHWYHEPKPDFGLTHPALCDASAIRSLLDQEEADRG